MKKTNKKFIRNFMTDYNNIVRELYEKENFNITGIYNDVSLRLCKCARAL